MIASDADDEKEEAGAAHSFSWEGNGQRRAAPLTGGVSGTAAISTALLLATAK